VEGVGDMDVEKLEKKLSGTQDNDTHPFMYQHCKMCSVGSCCQDGVDVDLEEAKKIAQLQLPLEKPWFELLQKDECMSSGWSLSTTVRDNRCVFQKPDKKCMIYDHRPSYCREFPLEDGDIAEYYAYLCKEPSHSKKRMMRVFKHNHIKE